MRAVIVTLIIAFLGSSLPTEVWACGLGVCPMKHTAMSAAKKMAEDAGAKSCHQHLQKQPSVVTEGAEQFKSNCQCDHFKTSVLIWQDQRLELKILKAQKTETLQSTWSWVKEPQQRLKTGSGPTLSLPRTHLLHQIFVI